MKEQVQMGVNRTGVQMSPMDSSEMAQDIRELMPANPGSAAAMDVVRGSYIADAEPVGSVPVPGTLKGAFSAGASMLTGSSPQFLLDKLGERLAFERTGTRLYDALITKVRAQAENGVATLPLDKLAAIREEEARHMELVGRAILSLGGDPTSMTPCADITGVEALGLVQVLNDPRSTVMQSLHAILVVELTDNNGWEMLIMLAREQKHDAMAADFGVALERERDHLQHVQAWFQDAMLAAANGHADAMGSANAGVTH